MTNQELNARAAEIMGFKDHPYGWIDCLNRLRLMEWKHGYDVDIWNPCENIAQAFELAHEMCEDYELKYNGDIYDFTIAGVLRRGDSLPDTITRACAAAAEAKK